MTKSLSTPTRTDDLVEIQQLLAKYAVTITQGDVEGLVTVFTPDGTYSAFGDTYPLADFPALVAAAPKGLFLVGPPALELNGDVGRGEQPLCFVEQTTHDVRIGYYSDTYQRTADGWRLRSRSMTFLRKSGARDSGRAHDPTRPAPITSRCGSGRRASAARTCSRATPRQACSSTGRPVAAFSATTSRGSVRRRCSRRTMSTAL